MSHSHHRSWKMAGDSRQILTRWNTHVECINDRQVQCKSQSDTVRTKLKHKFARSGPEQSPSIWSPSKRNLHTNWTLSRHRQACSCWNTQKPSSSFFFIHDRKNVKRTHEINSLRNYIPRFYWMRFFFYSELNGIFIKQSKRRNDYRVNQMSDTERELLIMLLRRSKFF